MSFAQGGAEAGLGGQPGRQQAIADTMRDLVLAAAACHRPSPRHHGHAGRPPRAVGRPGRARPGRALVPALHRSNSCNVWLLAWERGQDTDWHDHGGSSGSYVVADGSLIEQYRVPSGQRMARRRLALGEAVAFGPGHVHDVAHGGEASATSIHAYSPPLSAMTYYSSTDYGLIARETVAIDGPEGAPGRRGHCAGPGDGVRSRMTSDAPRRRARHRRAAGRGAQRADPAAA